MKKTLIALAALGAMAGAAQAQSTVTLYGVADVYFGQTSRTTKPTATGTETKLTQTVINSGGMNGSRWGLKGSEDLGGGLKANFQVESGFDISTGASGQGGLLFGRQALVGFSGGFGAVTLGRQYSAYDALRGATNNTYDSSFATTGTVWGNGVADYTGRVDNSIAYQSPNFNGFSGAVMVGLGENKTTTASASRNTSFNVQYANGPILAGYAHQAEKTVAVADQRKYNLLAASYDFGMASIHGGYNTAKLGSTKDKEYQLGVKVPFGAASVAAGYSRSKSDAAGVTSKATGYSIAGLYDLSKRTALYAGWNSTKADFVSATAAVKTSLVAVGVRHRF